jgi:hypothetical protein
MVPRICKWYNADQTMAEDIADLALLPEDMGDVENGTYLTVDGEI